MAKDRVSSKFMALKRDGTSPINFFGDNEFGWCPSEDMLSFNEHYNELSEQKMSRQYRVSTPHARVQGGQCLGCSGGILDEELV